MEERRLFERFGFKAPVRFNVSEGDISGKGSCEDISGGGIRIRSKSKIPLKSNLDLRIGLPQTDAQLSLSAKVVWRRKDPRGEYIFGLAFKDLDLMALWLVFKKIFHKWIKEDRIVKIF